MKYLGLGLVALCLGCAPAAEPPLYLNDRVFVWGEIQTDKNVPQEQWDWSAVDAVLAEYDQPVSVSVWPYALWDQVSCHATWSSVVTVYGPHFQAPYPPCDQAAYRTWLQAAQDKYADQVVEWRIIDEYTQQEPPYANFIGSDQDYQAILY